MTEFDDVGSMVLGSLYLVKQSVGKLKKQGVKIVIIDSTNI